MVRSKLPSMSLAMHRSFDARTARRCAAAWILVAALAQATTASAQPAPAADPALSPPALLSSSEVPYPATATGDAIVLLTLTIAPDGTVRSAVATEGNEPFASRA